jgi:hypothetical protein
MAHPKAGRPVEAEPVKYLSALLVPKGFDPEKGLFPALEDIFGRIDHRGAPQPFRVSDYYEEEMGPALSRILVSFERLDSPTSLVRIKRETASLEERFLREGSRTVNIDPGYMDYFKVVLASFKQGPQKIYIGEGVYADPVMLYQHGAFTALPWTFPDFKSGIYDGDLMMVRRIYRDARRAGGAGLS